MTSDEQYLQIFLEPVLKSKEYRPKFGNSSKTGGYSLEEFLQLYGGDPFYSWIGLDTEIMYAAHRAAGGMTSVYRQIGIGCENLFRQIIVDVSDYEDSDSAAWSYETKGPSGKMKVLTLDARLELAEMRNQALRRSVMDWMKAYCAQWSGIVLPENGVVFEVRQGYKSKDSKRQNADIDNSVVAWSTGYLPVFAVFSSQIDFDIVIRYRNSRSGILIGTNSEDPQTSIYGFSKTVLGYDLAEFFQRNSSYLQDSIEDVLETLLSAE